MGQTASSKQNSKTENVWETLKNSVIESKPPKGPDAVAHPCHPSTREAETGGSLWVWGKADLHSEFQGSQDYMERPCITFKKRRQQQQKRKPPKSS